uniref:Chorion protein S19 n=1 Tax=Strongyloides papillosus TaxID=174720 RepID=A0A0N5C0B5_STREA
MITDDVDKVFKFLGCLLILYAFMCCQNSFRACKRHAVKLYQRIRRICCRREGVPNAAVPNASTANASTLNVPVMDNSIMGIQGPSEYGCLGITNGPSYAADLGAIAAPSIVAGASVSDGLLGGQFHIPISGQTGVLGGNQVYVPYGSQIGVPHGSQISVPVGSQIGVPHGSQSFISANTQSYVPVAGFRKSQEDMV